MTKNDISAGESYKKISLISFNGVLKYIEIEKVSKFFEFHDLKQRNSIIVVLIFVKYQLAENRGFPHLIPIWPQSHGLQRQ